jgi:hypothetical protein
MDIVIAILMRIIEIIADTIEAIVMDFVAVDVAVDFVVAGMDVVDMEVAMTRRSLPMIPISTVGTVKELVMIFMSAGNIRLCKRKGRRIAAAVVATTTETICPRVGQSNINQASCTLIITLLMSLTLLPIPLSLLFLAMMRAG